jgi:hypothetical protein
MCMFMRTQIAKTLAICSSCGYPILRSDIITMTPSGYSHALCVRVR